MSVKHLKSYFNEVVRNWREATDDIRELEVEAAKGMVEPERLDKIKETVAPLMRNYETISYFMFLLDMPNKKEKQKRYERQNAKLLAQAKGKSTDYFLKQNREVIDKLEPLVHNGDTDNDNG